MTAATVRPSTRACAGPGSREAHTITAERSYTCWRYGSRTSGEGCGGGEPPVRMVVSFLFAPGARVRYVEGDNTIWSREIPSSRIWTRMVCGPGPAKYTSGPKTPAPHPLSCHPQPDSPHALHSSRFISAADVVPMRHVGAPPEVTLSENCTKTESFAYPSLDACPRIHNR